jgi:hypothetical protein
MQKGKTNNINGRPLGTKNKATVSTRLFLNKFMEKNRSQLQKDWNLLEPYQRVQSFEKLIAFILPKMSSLEIEALPESQLNDLINKLIEKNEQ